MQFAMCQSILQSQCVFCVHKQKTAQVNCKTTYHKWLQICFNYLHFSLFHNDFSNLHRKPWLGALNDWNVPGSWLHAVCLWLIKSYLLIRSSQCPFFRVPAMGFRKYSTGFIKDINELNPLCYNSLWSKKTTALCQFIHPDTLFTKQAL